MQEEAGEMERVKLQGSGQGCDFMQGENAPKPFYMDNLVVNN